MVRLAAFERAESGGPATVSTARAGSPAGAREERS